MQGVNAHQPAGGLEGKIVRGFRECGGGKRRKDNHEKKISQVNACAVGLSCTFRVLVCCSGGCGCCRDLLWSGTRLQGAEPGHSRNTQQAAGQRVSRALCRLRHLSTAKSNLAPMGSAATFVSYLSPCLFLSPYLRPYPRKDRDRSSRHGTRLILALCPSSSQGLPSPYPYLICID